MESNCRDRRIWDCNSSLYDSFELMSFKRQLDSVILINSVSRCLSMPRLSDLDPSQQSISQTPKKKKSRCKFSRSVQKLVRSLFRPKTGSTKHLSADGGHAAVPEENVPVKGVDFPTGFEFDFAFGSAVVRKTVSERFTRPVGGLRL